MKAGWAFDNFTPSKVTLAQTGFAARAAALNRHSYAAVVAPKLLRVLTDECLTFFLSDESGAVTVGLVSF